MKESDLLTQHFRLTPIQKSALKRLRIITIHDLLYHFPTRYEVPGKRTLVEQATTGTEVTLYGQFIKLEIKKSWKRRIPISEGLFEDGTGRMKTMWFHQPYIAKMVPLNMPVKISGKITGSDAKRYIANPSVERLTSLPENSETLLSEEPSFDDTSPDVPVLMPIYPESKGITSLWFYHALKRIFDSALHEVIVDPLPITLREKYHLPSIHSALVFIHTPHKERDAEAARKRFAFEEVLCVQLIAMGRRYARESLGALPIPLSPEDIHTFTSRFPFALTNAQKTAINTIVHDMGRPRPMSRLLEGDVGSGKTAVAATVCYAAINARDAHNTHLFTQVAYMAPTEILARQLYASFIQYFEHLPIKIGLLTSGSVQRFPSKSDPTQPTDISKAQLLKWTEAGDVQILIGTHALIQKSVAFRNLALVIVDEQHRFGTKQRLALTKKHTAPHLLSMTATPIPRTLALTVYGDLDLTLLDAMPPGRKPVITEVLSPATRKNAYDAIVAELKRGRQAYVICPRIDAPDPDEMFALNAKSVVETVKELRAGVFKDFSVGAVHSKLSQDMKETVMEEFADHRIDVLVATSVVEVGVNVPNATCIVIEGAERFGLAQLHQLRGRVIRSTHQAYCYLINESKGTTSKERLKAIATAKNGFELAEKDLALRGAGELYGGKQWGVSDIGMEAIKNIKMVEAARIEAQKIVETDPMLKQHPKLKTRAEAREEVLHFE